MEAQEEEKKKAKEEKRKRRTQQAMEVKEKLDPKEQIIQEKE